MILRELSPIQMAKVPSSLKKDTRKPQMQQSRPRAALSKKLGSDPNLKKRLRQTAQMVDGQTI
jgi:hypothetical protein